MNLSGEEETFAVIRKKGLPPLNSSRYGPHGYWFLVAVALSNCIKPSDNYVLAVYCPVMSEMKAWPSQGLPDKSF